MGSSAEDTADSGNIDNLLRAVLRTPGGEHPIEPLKPGSSATHRFDGGILRMLSDVDEALSNELRAQKNAIDEYLDPQLLMPHYEKNFVARLAVEQLLPDGVRKAKLLSLDVGCGVGLLGRLYPELDLVGLDASIDLLELAATGYRLRIEGSAEALPFSDASFDLILAINMLHHVIRPELAVSEFARVLKPGGMLIAVDPRKVWYVEIGKKLLRSNNDAFADTHKSFSMGDYRSLIESQGRFKIDRFERVGLLGPIGMGGLDATRLSKMLPSAEAAVNQFIRLDERLLRLPFLSRAGLNLAVRAVRTERT